MWELEIYSSRELCESIRYTFICLAEVHTLGVNTVGQKLDTW
jgi:hypothetical protein